MNSFIKIIFLLFAPFCLGKKYGFAQTLIAHYPFDNNVKDVSGNKNNGVIIGDIKPAIDRFGDYCGALSFSGQNSYIEVPNSKSLSSIDNKISVSCWVKLESNHLQPTDKWLTLICKGEDVIETNNNPQYRIQIFQSDKQSTVSINTEFTEYDFDFNNHNLDYGKWYFYTLVYDGSMVKMYLNANKVWEFGYSGVFNVNNMPLNIGRDVPGSLEFFYGSLDDLRIYNGVLKESDIVKLYNYKPNSVPEEPFILKCPDNISLNTVGDNCSTIVNYNEPELKINCGDVSMKLIKGLPSGSVFPVGITSITYKIESTVGRKKTCSFNVYVKDNVSPKIKCPADISLYTDANIDYVKYDYDLPFVSDECGIDSLKLVSGIQSGGNFPVGNTQNRFIVFDKNGNTSECSFNVKVQKKSSSGNSAINSNTATVSSIISQNVVSNDSITKNILHLHDENVLKIKNINDSLVKVQTERDKLVSEKLKLEQDREKLEILKKQQEKEVLGLKLMIDSLERLRKQLNNDQIVLEYNLFNVPLKVGAVAQINNVYFVADASFLQISSYAELDKIVFFLQKNSNLKVEIGGHTNGLCDDHFCIKLSTSRAKTCVDYLISKGVNPDRLIYKGYGKSQLIKPESPGDPLNQRVEIKIVGI